MTDQVSRARADALGAVAMAGRDLSTAIVYFHGRVAARLGLGPTDYKLLGIVQQLGSARPVDLTDATGLAKNSITDALDRLTRQGFIERTTDVNDRRRVRVEVTAAGIRQVEDLLGDLMSNLGQLQGEFSTAELATIARYESRAAAIQSASAAALL